MWGYIMAQIYLESEQRISSVIHIQHDQIIDYATRLYFSQTQVLSRAMMLKLEQNQVFDTMTPVYLTHEQVFHGMVQIAINMTQIFRCYGPPVVLEFLQTFASYDYNLIYLPFVQIIGAQLDSVLQEIQFSVMVAASRVGVTSCQFDREGFVNSATIMLRDRSEWNNKQVGDPVLLTVLGVKYMLVVVNKPQDERISQGGVERGYVLECMSITCQLAEGINPDISAARVTESFPAGTMLTEILDYLTEGVCEYTLSVPDFPVGNYEFSDSERYAALRQVLPEEYGWLINTDQDGVLQIGQWSLPAIGEVGQKTLAMTGKSLTPPSSTLYTQVEISNYDQQAGTSGLTLEVEDNGDGTGTIYGYSVPWTDSFKIFDSKDSPAPSLLITGGIVENSEVFDTDVEFTEYSASLSKPCYGIPIIDWGENDSLSPISYTESGSLGTEVDPGYSVAVNVTYQTRRKKWIFDNRTVDVSQVRLKYV